MERRTSEATDLAALPIYKNSNTLSNHKKRGQGDSRDVRLLSSAYFPLLSNASVEKRGLNNFLKERFSNLILVYSALHISSYTCCTWSCETFEVQEQHETS